MNTKNSSSRNLIILYKDYNGRGVVVTTDKLPYYYFCSFYNLVQEKCNVH